MAQPKPKKKRRSRSDPARRDAAARREEARRRAAEERRREQEAAERRTRIKKRIRRFGIPAAVGIAVIVAAAFIFRTPSEIDGVRVDDTGTLLDDLVSNFPDSPDQASLPEPACGLQEDISPEALYATLRGGAVALFYPPGDTAAQAALTDLARQREYAVVVIPDASVDEGVVAVAWQRRMDFDAPDDPVIGKFVDHYRKGETCLVPAD